MAQPIKKIEFRKFMRDIITLIVPLDHPWAEKKIIDPQDLYGEDFLTRESDSGTYIAMNSALSNIGIQTSDLNTLMTLGNSEAIALSVQEGLGIGFVSEIVVSMLGRGRVVPIKVRGLDIFREIYIGHNTSQLATIAQNTFWEFVQSLPYPFPVS